MPFDQTPHHTEDLLELENVIDIHKAPFSYPGSRWLIWGSGNGLLVKRASRDPFFPIALGQQETIWIDHLRLQFADGEKRALEVSIDSYPHLLRFKTEIGHFQLAFLDPQTIAIGLPAGQDCGIILQVSGKQTRPGDLGSDRRKPPPFSWSATCPLKSISTQDLDRGIEIGLTVNSPADDAILLHFQDPDQRHPVPDSFSIISQKSEQRWLDWFQSTPEFKNHSYHKQYKYAWWVLANNLVDPGGCLAHSAVMPSKAKYIGVWNWDTGFHAVALRHLDPRLARDQLRLILDHQLENGMLPDAVHQDGIVDWIDHPIEGDVTKPPVLAWAALKVHEVDPDPAFLQEIYPLLCRWNSWWFTQVDQAGMPQYHHPYSSGLDDSPLWDSHFPVTSPDLSAYLIVQMNSLAAIARILGEIDQAADWEEQAADLADLLIRELFDPDKGVFNARTNQGIINESTPFNYLPIWTGMMPDEINRAAVNALLAGGRFWKKFPLQTVSSLSKNYQPDVMWRGPIWININYLFIEALEEIGEIQLARQLAKSTLDLVNLNQGIFEYYHPDTGLPPKAAAPVFSWSAALFIDLALKYGSRDGGEGDML